MNGNKNTFWQALLMALAVFWIGIFLGVMFENSRVSELEGLYYDSETGVFDVFLTKNIIKSEKIDCSLAIENSINFADKIYFEAVKLEKYDSSNRVTDKIVRIHKKYDLLRVMLWSNLNGLRRRCKDEFKGLNVLVYLYDYKDTNLDVSAKQGAIAGVLLDLKREMGDSIILIPIAVDTNVNSLELLLKSRGINEFPTVLINENDKLVGLFNRDKIVKILNLN